MKKFISKVSAVAIASSIAFGASAYAKTEGAYIGVSVLKANTESEYKEPLDQGFATGEKVSDSKVQFGVDAKYAFNMNNFFIAPGLFYERIGSNSYYHTDGADSAAAKINNRYGVKLDLGYDVNENLGVYFTNGYSHTRIKQDWSDADTNLSTETLTEGENSYFYGFGLTSRINERFSIGAEYNKQTIKTASLGRTESFRASQRFNTDLEVYKLTLSYNF